MKKYEKMFIPVESDEDEHDFKFILYGYAGKLEVPVKEQSNVIVLTEDELVKLLLDSWIGGHNCASEDDDSVNFETFLKQKGLSKTK